MTSRFPRRPTDPVKFQATGTTFRGHGDLLHMTYAEVSDRRVTEAVANALNKVEFYFDPTGIKRRIGDREFNEITQQVSAPCSQRPWMNWEEVSPDVPTEAELPDIVNRLNVSVYRGFAAAIGRDVRPLAAWGWEFPRGKMTGFNYPVNKPDSLGYIDLRVGGLCALLESFLVGEATGKVNEFNELDSARLSLYVLITDQRAVFNPFKAAEMLKGDPKLEHQVLRVHFFEDDLFPTPGEFLGLAVSFILAMPVQQNTKHSLFTGQYVETRSYTSGIVEGVNTVGDDKTYDIRVKNVLMTGIESTDWYTYSVGERVAVIRQPLSSDNANTIMSDELVFDGSDLFKIAPISFYEGV